MRSLLRNAERNDRNYSIMKLVTGSQMGCRGKVQRLFTWSKVCGSNRQLPSLSP